MTAPSEAQGPAPHSGLNWVCSLGVASRLTLTPGSGRAFSSEAPGHPQIVPLSFSPFNSASRPETAPRGFEAGERVSSHLFSPCIHSMPPPARPLQSTASGSCFPSSSCQAPWEVGRSGPGPGDAGWLESQQSPVPTDLGFSHSSKGASLLFGVRQTWG